MAFSTIAQPAPQGAGDFATFLDAGGASQVAVPGGDLLLLADYVRDGDDLVLVGPDGDTVVVLDYFAGGTPPALATDGGAVIAPDLAMALAGETPPVQLAQASGGGGAQAIGRVVSATGNITAVHAGGGDEPLDAGDPVFKGDVLQTGPDGTLEVEFEDGSKLKLSANARMVVDDLVYDPGADQGSALFSLVQGTFGFESGEIAATGPDAIQIRTPVATIGIRGTVLLINVDQSGDVLSITVVGDSGSIALIDPVTGEVIGTLTGTSDGSQPNTVTFSPGEDGPTYSFIAPQDLGEIYGMQGVEQAAALLDTEAGPQGDGDSDGDPIQIVVVDPQGNFTVVSLSDFQSLTGSKGNVLDFQFGGGTFGDGTKQDSTLFGGDTELTGGTQGPLVYTPGSGDASFSGGDGFDIMTIDATTGGPYVFEIGQDPSNGNVLITQLDGQGGTVATITLSAIEEVVLNLGGGSDTITVGALDQTDIADDTVIIRGGPGDDVLDASATDKRVELYGEAGDDVLFGGSSGDLLDGGTGDNFLDGGPGDDVLTAGGGHNVLIGGRGDDLLRIEDGGEGRNVLIGDAVTTASLASEAVNIAFAIDVSGSMNIVVGQEGESRLELAVQAIKSFVQELRDKGLPDSTEIYFIPFSSDVSNETEFTLGQYSEEGGIADFLDGLSARGGTVFVHPLEEASAWLQEDAEGVRPGHEGYDASTARFVDHTNRLYFLSDGVDNSFRSVMGDPGELLSALYGTEDVDQIPDLEVKAFGFGAQSVDVDLLDLVVIGGDPYAEVVNNGVADFAVVVDDDPQLLTDAFGAGSIVDEVPGEDVIFGGGGDDLIFGDIPALSHAAKAEYDAAPAEFDFFAFTQDVLLENGSSYDPELRALTDSVGEADLIHGGAGNDIIFGQGGDDVIVAGPGMDLVFGGDGDDLIFGDSPALNEAAKAQYDAAPSEFDFLGYAQDFLLEDGVSYDPELRALTDSIGEGSVIHGGAGNDIIFGQGGGALISGGRGEDLILGGDGVDLIFGDVSFWSLIDLELGPEDPGLTNEDLAFFSAFIGLAPFLGGEEIDLELFEPGVFELINSVGEDDVIHGGAGNDVIFGQGGDDVIFGGPGDDVIFGGDGNDRIIGGGGLDLLVGGAGDDIFVFETPEDGTVLEDNSAAPEGTNVILDFVSGSDTIELGQGFGTLSGIGTLTDGENFKVLDVEYDGTNGGGTAWDNGEAAILLDSAGNLIYDANGEGEGYTILANVGDAAVAAADVSAPAAVGA